MVRRMMMSVMEVAKIMGTTSEVIRNRLARGMIPKSLTYKIGRRRFFDREAFRDWIEANRQKDSE